MCGIVGYTGTKNALPILLEGLRRLEYRGYDSSGIALESNGEITLWRTEGKITNLENMIAESPSVVGLTGIAHTRWATHGIPSKENAHPHHDCKGQIYLVHNGIIENYEHLKRTLLQEGHRFTSDTDTEVLVHLLEKYYINNLEEALQKALVLIRGTYGLAVICSSEPNKIVAARLGSPLLIGIGEHENIIASDASAVLRHTRQVIYLDEGEIATVTPDSFSISTIDKKLVTKEISTVEWDITHVQKNGFAHFMLKEIYEQPQVIENTIRGRLIPEEGLVKLGGLENVYEKLAQIKRIILVSCGTAYYAGLTQKYMLEEYGGVSVEVELASEFRYRKLLFEKDTCALIAISQSGETADTLAALREVKRKGMLVLGIVNVVGSTIAREADAGVYTHAGPEIGVASTKAFISQLCVLALLTIMIGRQRDMSIVIGQQIVNAIKELPDKIRWILTQNNANIRQIAHKYFKFENFLYLGRKYNYPIALEGALKLKEISYIHAEGYAAGEMKHGPIALIDENFPTVAIIPSDSIYEKIKSNLEEIRARKGKIIVVATEGNEEIIRIADEVIYIPKTLEMLTPTLSVVPLQLLAYHIAVLRNCDVDQPKNLAKSVTVE